VRVVWARSGGSWIVWGWTGRGMRRRGGWLRVRVRGSLGLGVGGAGVGFGRAGYEGCWENEEREERGAYEACTMSEVDSTSMKTTYPERGV
jgi:hypothetical protein